MGNLSIPNILIIGATFLALALLLHRSSQSYSKRYARIRIPIDDRRRGQPMSDPQEEEFDPAAWMEWFLFGSLLLLIVIMLGRAA